MRKFSILLLIILNAILIGLSSNSAYADDPPTVVSITGDTEGTTGENVTLEAVVEDDIGVVSATFYVGTAATAAGAQQVGPTQVQQTFTTIVPIPANSVDDIPYYFEASDAADNTVRSPETGTYTISVIDNDSPTVAVTQPNGGETWNIGRRYDITWTAEDNISVTSIDILYSTDNGFSWEQIATGEDNDGIYRWEVPDTPSTTCLVKVVAYDAADNSTEDVSDDVFTIKIVKILYPFSDDMENPDSGNWDFDPPWGYTTEASHSGSKSITDSPGGDYANNVNISTTLSAGIDLSSAEMPVLTFWHRYSLEKNKDFGYIDVSTDEGKSWNTIYFVTGHHTEWKEEKIDLTPYSYIKIRFRLKTNSSIRHDGWYIDDLSIDETKVTISYPFSDDMESGTENWFTSSWDLVTPGHTSVHCLTDSPEGNPPKNTRTWLTLANTIDLSSAEKPQLTFWHHYKLDYDQYGYVQISIDKGRTYTTLKRYGDRESQSDWVQVQIDLSDYVEYPPVRIRFRLSTDDRSWQGWYIDDVRIGEDPETLVDWCNLDSPASTSTNVGEPTENIYGLVYEEGVTDSPGQGEGIVVQLGYGSDGSSPPTEWTWVNATYDSDVENDVGTCDKYVATLTVDEAGRYDYAYRFRLEENGVWAYADLDGNDLGSGGTNGYSPSQAGDLTVEEGPSEPYIIISTDKETYFEGDEMTVYADAGNPTESMISNAGVALYVVGRFGVIPYQQTGPFNMPPEFSVEDFELLSIPSVPALEPATYAWLAVLFSETNGYLDHSVTIWSFSESISAAKAALLRKIADEYVRSLTLDQLQNMRPGGLDALNTLAKPERTLVFQNVPNPLNPDTWIPYQLKEDADVTIRIYNPAGQLVRILNLGYKEAGFHITKERAAYWDGKNSRGERVSSGIYFYTLKAGDFVATKKLVILK